MIIQNLIRPKTEFSKKLARKFDSFESLIVELNKKEISEEIAELINKEIAEVNLFAGDIKDLSKLLSRAQTKILKLVEKELQIVPKNHYRNIWLAVGMSGFGIPLGAAFGAAMDNMAFLGIGLPIGLAIGIAIGSAKDKKVQETGKQLNWELN